MRWKCPTLPAMSSFLPACWQAWVGTRGERRGGRLEAGEGGAGSPLGPPSPEAAGGGVGFDPQNITHVGVGSREVGRASRLQGRKLGIWGVVVGAMGRVLGVQGSGPGRCWLSARGSWRAPGQPSSEPFLRTPHGGSRELERRDCCKGLSSDPQTLRETRAVLGTMACARPGWWVHTSSLGPWSGSSA